MLGRDLDIFPLRCRSRLFLLESNHFHVLNGNRSNDQFQLLRCNLKKAVLFFIPLFVGVPTAPYPSEMEKRRLLETVQPTFWFSSTSCRHHCSFDFGVKMEQENGEIDFL